MCFEFVENPICGFRIRRDSQLFSFEVVGNPFCYFRVPRDSHLCFAISSEIPFVVFLFVGRFFEVVGNPICDFRVPRDSQLCFSSTSGWTFFFSLKTVVEVRLRKYGGKMVVALLL